MDFSGLERDKLFLSSEGKTFQDVSYLSRVDNVQDGRTFAYSDLDHNGSPEIILVNRNAPILVIYQNTLIRGDWISLYLIGDGRRSNRDAVGTRVSATCGGKTVTREIDLGTGFGIQNTKTLTIGLGNCKAVEQLKVRWPDGTKQTFSGVASREYYELNEGKDLQLVPGFYKNSSQLLQTAQ
jgi:hypothetical protein